MGKYKEGNRNYPQFHAPDLPLRTFGCVSLRVWATSHSQNYKVWLWDSVTTLSRPPRFWGWDEPCSHRVPAGTGVFRPDPPFAARVKQIGFQTQSSLPAKSRTGSPTDSRTGLHSSPLPCKSLAKLIHTLGTSCLWASP